MKKFVSILMLLILILLTYTTVGDFAITLYAPDGKEIIVNRTEAEQYIELGWYTGKDDMTQTIYAPDGREEAVYASEVETYKELGWYETKEEVTATMCAADNRKIKVYLAEIEDYTSVGWELAQNNETDPSKPMVALTFDDGPGAYTTDRILDTLEKYNARATFFVIGDLAAKNPSALQRMQSLGCQIGNHTYSHLNLTKLTPEDMSIQLYGADKAIVDAVGYIPSAVRPPYGAVDDNVIATVDRPLVLWSIDTLDWKNRNVDYVVDAALSKVKDGDIILMHDIYETTAASAEIIIPVLIKRGYQLVTIDELASSRNTPMTAHNKYRHFR